MVMENEKLLINDLLHAWRVSWKFLIPTMCNFLVNTPMNFFFKKKIVCFLTLSIVFPVCKQPFSSSKNLKIRRVIDFSGYAVYVEVEHLFVVS